MSKTEEGPCQVKCKLSRTIASCSLLSRPETSVQREAVRECLHKRRAKCKRTDTTSPSTDQRVLWRTDRSEKPQKT